jgi:molecular chaperone DnaK (HSP70)
MSRFLVGIDLGTTNSALAYIDLQNRPRVGNLGLKTFAIPQLVAPRLMGDRPLLPSFLYLPGQHDLPAGWRTRWDTSDSTGRTSRRSPSP